jgi:hypothetical protein
VNVRLLAAVSVVILLTAATACGGGGDDDDGTSGSPLLELLGAIPDTPDAASYVTYADLDAYYDALGVGSPPKNASQDEFDEWLGELSDAERSGEFAQIRGGAQFALDGLRDVEAYRDEIAIDPARITQSIEAGSPPETYTVLSGDFDAGDVSDAVENDETWSQLLEEPSHGGVSYWSWGEDFETDFARNTPVHTLGRGGRLALHNDLALWCFWTAGMAGMIDAMTDATGSLADHPEFAHMIELLDEQGVYYFTMAATPPDDADDTSADEADDRPYGFITEAGGTDAEGPYLYLLIGSGTEAVAQQSVGLLQQIFEDDQEYQGVPMSERVESMEIHAEGTMTIATLRGENLPWDLYASTFPLLDRP